MLLLAVGCSFRTAPVAVRERLAFDAAGLDRAQRDLADQTGCEAVVLGTCNRVEVYLGRASGIEPDAAAVARFLAGGRIPPAEVLPHLYEHRGIAAVEHLFRVASGLDSLVLGEGQITGQVRDAYDRARAGGSVGPVLNPLFQQSLRTAKRVRTQTGIARGRVSVAGAAVDYVRQVFSRFEDKTVLVIGAGKMGELTLRHLRSLRPKELLVTNRTEDRASALAARWGGRAVPWDRLNDALVRADIVLSSTGAADPIVSAGRWHEVLARRGSRSVVILDIAVPRDFDPRVHDGERTCVVNVDDLRQVCDRALAERRSHVGAAEAIVADQARAFMKDWARRRNGPVIERLTRDLAAKRRAVLGQLLSKLDGRLGEADKRHIECALRLFESQILHGPISALADEAAGDRPPALAEGLRDALRRLFRLSDSASAPPADTDCPVIPAAA